MHTQLNECTHLNSCSQTGSSDRWMSLSECSQQMGGSKSQEGRDTFSFNKGISQPDLRSILYCIAGAVRYAVWPGWAAVLDNTMPLWGPLTTPLVPSGLRKGDSEIANPSLNLWMISGKYLKWVIPTRISVSQPPTDSGKLGNLETSESPSVAKALSCTSLLISDNSHLGNSQVIWSMHNPVRIALSPLYIGRATLKNPSLQIDFTPPTPTISQSSDDIFSALSRARSLSTADFLIIMS